MAWLIRDGDVLASLEVADSVASRTKGLLGRDGIDGAMLLTRTRGVHSLLMRFPIDVAFCDKDLTVLETIYLPPHRLAMPRLHARCVIEARAGAFEQWKLQAGDQLEIKGP
ncbi:MAG TPA: DUF192 domain-containing protein [Acidimicrobiales bacterium]|nr:DUF192 domain-containing protein [Acidimicrobiales bacterium]